MEHASLEAPALWQVPPATAHHLAQVGAAGGGEAVVAVTPLLPVEVPEGGGAALEDLHTDSTVAWRPLAHAHGGDGGGEAAGPGWRQAVED